MSHQIIGHQVIEKALALSKADNAIVMAGETSSVNLRWADNSLTTNGSSRTRTLIVISIIGQSFGVRSISNFDDESIETAVRLSEADARNAKPADDYNELVNSGESSDFHEPADFTSPELLAGFARSLSDTFAAARADGLHQYGFADHHLTTSWLGTTSGTRQRHTQPTGTAQFTLKNNSPHGSAWYGQSTRDFTDVIPSEIDALLRQRLQWSSRYVELPSGRYECILSPSCLGDMLFFMYAFAMSARDTLEGRTVFSKADGETRLGEQIAPKGFYLLSDPYDIHMPVEKHLIAPASSSETSVFDNGFPLERTEWIRDGNLENLISTRKTRLPDKNVTPQIDNMIAEANSSTSLEEMISSTKRGLLLNCFWYIRGVTPQSLLTTGLTRDGVYLIENGEVTGAVNNFRFNESPVSLLGRIAESSETQQCLMREWGEYMTNIRMPAVRIPDFNMSSVSQAT